MAVASIGILAFWISGMNAHLKFAEMSLFSAGCAAVLGLIARFLGYLRKENWEY